VKNAGVNDGIAIEMVGVGGSVQNVVREVIGLFDTPANFEASNAAPLA
jgi:hypothetical protein